jgi:hypothetical protein
MARTDTDLLAKNSNMLALAGGNTDLARTLAESANPNTKMTPQAIQAAADQVIAQQKLALAKQKLLQPIKALNDPAMYTRRSPPSTRSPTRASCRSRTCRRKSWPHEGGDVATRAGRLPQKDRPHERARGHQ